MAGRQKHTKRYYDLSSPVRYVGKMYALFKSYMGAEYAKKLAEAMLKEYEDTSVAYYTKVRDDQELRTYLNTAVGSAKQFEVFQVINEFISSVLLTRNETATMVYYKYNTQGLESDVILNVMARVANIIGQEIPAFVASTRGEAVTPGNVIRVVDSYVVANPPAPRSYGGKATSQTVNVVPARYAGTKGFSGYSEVGSALEEVKRMLGGVE